MVPALPITETEGFGKNALGLHEIPIITPMKLPWNPLKYLYSHRLDDWQHEIPTIFPLNTLNLYYIPIRLPLNILPSGYD